MESTKKKVRCLNLKTKQKRFFDINVTKGRYFRNHGWVIDDADFVLENELLSMPTEEPKERSARLRDELEKKRQEERDKLKKEPDKPDIEPDKPEVEEETNDKPTTEEPKKDIPDIEDLTKAKIIEDLRAKDIKFNITDKKQVLFDKLVEAWK